MNVNEQTSIGCVNSQQGLNFRKESKYLKSHLEKKCDNKLTIPAKKLMIEATWEWNP
jgi:hypothetical protein